MHTFVVELMHSFDRRNLRTNGHGKKWEEYRAERRVMRAVVRRSNAGAQVKKALPCGSNESQTTFTHPFSDYIPLERLYEATLSKTRMHLFLYLTFSSC